jgi:hypothetical protein
MLHACRRETAHNAQLTAPRPMHPVTMKNLVQRRRDGRSGAIVHGRQREGRQKRVVAAKEGGDKYDICSRAPETLAPPLI